MADRTQPDTESGKEKPEKPRDAGTSRRGTPDIQPGMNEREIREAGLAIDVPFETSGEPERLRYANLGKTRKADEAGGEKQ